MNILKRRNFDTAVKTLRSEDLQREYISTGSSEVNKLLGGGLPSGFVIHVYGPPGSGKTNLCLSAASKLKPNEKTLFIDTENGLSAERLMQVCRGKLPKNFFIKQLHDFDEQGRIVRGLCKILDKNFRLVIIDSMVSLYRLRLDGKRKNVLNLARELGRELGHLSKLARENNLTVILSNQVYKSFDGEEEIVPVGGDTLMYWSKVILELRKGKENGQRHMIVKKHPHEPEGKSIKFQITSSGMK